jgi:hypothetical protein
MKRRPGHCSDRGGVSLCVLDVELSQAFQQATEYTSGRGGAHAEQDIGERIVAAGLGADAGGVYGASGARAPRYRASHGG